MPERFLLDSSALIAFLQAEPGAPRVLDLLEKAARIEAEVVACFVSLTEVQYITAYDHGEEPARKATPTRIFPSACTASDNTQLSAPGLNPLSRVPSAFRRPMYLRVCPPSVVKPPPTRIFPPACTATDNTRAFAPGLKPSGTGDWAEAG